MYNPYLRNKDNNCLNFTNVICIFIPVPNMSAIQYMSIKSISCFTIITYYMYHHDVELLSHKYANGVQFIHYVSISLIQSNVLVTRIRSVRGVCSIIRPTLLHVVPLHCLHAREHRRPIFLQLQVFLSYLPEHLHLIIFSRAAGAGIWSM